MTKFLFPLFLGLALGLSGCGPLQTDVHSTIDIKIGLVVISKHSLHGRYFLHVRPTIGLPYMIEVDKATYDRTMIGDPYLPRK